MKAIITLTDGRIIEQPLNVEKPLESNESQDMTLDDFELTLSSLIWEDTLPLRPKKYFRIQTKQIKKIEIFLEWETDNERNCKRT